MRESGIQASKLMNYYSKTYQAIRAVGNDCILVISPLLEEQSPSDGWSFLLNQNTVNVWHDWHKYLIWGYEGQTLTELSTALDGIESDIKNWEGPRLFMGEMSFAVTSSAETNEEDFDFQFYASKMIRVFNNAKAGWTYWNWKTSDLRSKWNMQALARKGVFKDLMTTTALGVSTCGTLEPNVTYSGSVILSTTRADETLCCSDCAATMGCVAFFWNQSSCSLLSSIGTKSSLAGAKFGILRLRPTPS